MEYLIPLVLLAVGGRIVRAQEQRQRIGLLARYLGRFQIERLIETLLQGYMRALDERDPERRAQIWSMLETAEAELGSQFGKFADAFGEVWGDKALVSTLPLALPYATHLFPRATFDLRRVMAIHAQGIGSTVANARGLSLRDKAYTLTAEILLMQHSCHWFCRSRAVASARMLARHQTSYAQLLDSVNRETRENYDRAVGRRNTRAGS